MMIELAHSNNYRILHEFETVWLLSVGRENVVIGDFYGDPQVAVIDEDEKWCAVAGCGLIVYFLREPFLEYRYNLQVGQYLEFGRTVGAEWWIDHIEQIGPFNLKVILESGEVRTISFHPSGNGRNGLF